VTTTPNDHDPFTDGDSDDSGETSESLGPPPSPPAAVRPALFAAAPAEPALAPPTPAAPSAPAPTSRWGDSPASSSWPRPSAPAAPPAPPASGHPPFEAAGPGGAAPPRPASTHRTGPAVPPPTPPGPPRTPPSQPEVAPPPVPSSTVDTRAPGWVLPLVLLGGLALFVGGALAGWAIAERGSDDPVGGPATTAEVPVTPATGGGEGGIVPSGVEEPVAAVAQAVAPSVVQIDTNFGLGSGIIMDDEGHILTAAHVIEGAVQVRVRLADGTMVPATIVGTHPQTDVGVVRVEPRPEMVPATLGVDADIQVGQLAVAVGSPFGLEQTVTSGIVSALDRPVQTEGSLLVGMIQTDASINPGNSGGALADRHGRVIGINDAIRTQGGGNEGVGFAIPIDLAASVAERLIAGEPIRSGFLGVAANNPVEGRPGAVVQEVTPGTPAETAGIRVGDLIVAVDGQTVRGIQDLRARILTLEPGTPISIEVFRDGEVIEFEVVLAVNTQ
jgi:putative serine protease PepD